MTAERHSASRAAFSLPLSRPNSGLPEFGVLVWERVARAVGGHGDPLLAAVLIGYIGTMTKLLEKGIEAVRGLPADRQDMAGELLLSLAETGAQYSLTAEQLADVKLAIAEADRGNFASDSEMAETWKKFGR